MKSAVASSQFIKECSSIQWSSPTAAEIQTTAPPVLTALILIAFTSLGGCASRTLAYNPDHLSTDQVQAIGKICHTVMGLNPSEPLTDNSWPGDPDPGTYTNNYRGCIASISNSLRNKVVAREQMQADQDCRAKGLPVGSPDLAECVQQVVHLRPATYKHTADISIAESSSTDTLSREQQACADIGLEPTQRAFTSCTRDLRDVLSASEMEADYQN